MNILEKIKHWSVNTPDTIAIHTNQGNLTYKELWEKSDRLANWIKNNVNNNHPIVVYGHKDPLMIVCFLACAKSGHGYCPVDISMPEDRVVSIINKVDNSIVLTTVKLINGNELVKEEFDCISKNIIDKPEIEKIISNENNTILEIEKSWLGLEDIFYIIFTSGSTGMPKGVQITNKNLSKYTDWSSTVGGDKSEKTGAVFMNQAPFSFDLSVMDLYTGLTNGATVWCVSKKLQKDIGKMLQYLKEGKIQYWVSTPSFADMCLADRSFNKEILTDIKVFLFCGERLTCETVNKLYERFPKALVVNTYGPTESTVAVTGVDITKDMALKGENLPIGVAKPGTSIIIEKEDGKKALQGEKGEILIVGDTVSPGYFKEKEKTEKVFSNITIDNKQERCYRTGDEGYLL